MPGISQPEYKNIELDTDLLATPFKVQTNWHVITGAPSCGKTTLINQLAGQGFQVAPEGARLYLERELAKGRTLAEIRSNMADVQRHIVDIQLDIEGGLPPAACIFLDRAIPDHLAWYRYFGLNPNAFLQDCFRYRYASVFLLDCLPNKLDGLRYKDPALQRFTEQWHLRDYRALGYSITRVPVLPPEERLAFVLRALSGQGLTPQQEMRR